nr:hypothetical protein [Micromonospora sp. DSM 115978]
MADTRAGKKYIKENIQYRFRGFVLDGRPSLCWEWQKFLDRDGYGQSRKGAVNYGPKIARVHIAAYLLWRGPIKNELDHLCRN